MIINFEVEELKLFNLNAKAVFDAGLACYKFILASLLKSSCIFCAPAAKFACVSGCGTMLDFRWIFSTNCTVHLSVS